MQHDEDVAATAKAKAEAEEAEAKAEAEAEDVAERAKPERAAYFTDAVKALEGFETRSPQQVQEQTKARNQAYKEGQHAAGSFLRGGGGLARLRHAIVKREMRGGGRDIESRRTYNAALRRYRASQR